MPEHLITKFFREAIGREKLIELYDSKTQAPLVPPETNSKKIKRVFLPEHPSASFIQAKHCSPKSCKACAWEEVNLRSASSSEQGMQEKQQR